MRHLHHHIPKRLLYSVIGHYEIVTNKNSFETYVFLNEKEISCGRHKNLAEAEIYHQKMIDEYAYKKPVEVTIDGPKSFKEIM